MVSQSDRFRRRDARAWTGSPGVNTSVGWRTRWFIPQPIARCVGIEDNIFCLVVTGDTHGRFRCARKRVTGAQRTCNGMSTVNTSIYWDSSLHIQIPVLTSQPSQRKGRPQTPMYEVSEGLELRFLRRFAW